MFSVGSTFYRPIVILYSYFYIFLYFLYFVKILISRPGPPFTEARGEQDGGPGAGHPFLARFGWPEENIVRPPTEIDYFVISITLRKVSFMKKTFLNMITSLPRFSPVQFGILDLLHNF